MTQCYHISGSAHCEFPKNHGGKWHGVFRGVSKAKNEGAFLRLWPKSIGGKREPSRVVERAA